MKITQADVRHVAGLAELELAESDIDRITNDLERIVTFVEQLDHQVASAGVVIGPAELRLREDIVDPIKMTRRPADIAPAFDQGFFLVPRLDGLSDE